MYYPYLLRLRFAAISNTVGRYRKQSDTGRELRRVDVDKAGRQERHVRVPLHRRGVDIFGPQRLLSDREPDEAPERHRGHAQVFRVRDPTEVRDRLADR